MRILSFCFICCGSALLLLSFGVPYSVKFLHFLGILQGWDGFGLFVIGLQLLPYVGGASFLMLVVGVIGIISTRKK